VYTIAVENAMNTGAIGNDLKFNEEMLFPVASEIKKIRPHESLKRRHKSRVK